MHKDMKTIPLEMVDGRHEKTKVLVVDDSALVRQILTEILNSDPSIDVVGVASDPFMAREKIKEINPDVLTLDVEMPRMDGITFLRNLMRLRPMPVIMVSTLTEHGAEITLDALEIGAIDFITKPKIDLAHTLKAYADELINKVKLASNVCVRSRAEKVTGYKTQSQSQLSEMAKLANNGLVRHFKTTDKIIAIGASTGGTEAIKDVLTRLPADAPGIVITQHIPEAFSGPFAKRMDKAAAVTVYEAKDGQIIVPGHAYIAPGNRHLEVVRDGARYVCRLCDGPTVNQHKPSVDVMFRSVAQHAGRNSIGVILTGMGYDGASGMLEMKQTGAATIAQDEKTSVVWGMPGEAVKLGGVDKIMPLLNIADEVIRLSSEL
jgi:two-component system chemotaxis response regulator CheB